MPQRPQRLLLCSTPPLDMLCALSAAFRRPTGQWLASGESKAEEADSYGGFVALSCSAVDAAPLSPHRHWLWRRCRLRHGDPSQNWKIFWSWKPDSNRLGAPSFAKHDVGSGDLGARSTKLVSCWEAQAPQRFLEPGSSIPLTQSVPRCRITSEMQPRARSDE